LNNDFNISKINLTNTDVIDTFSIFNEKSYIVNIYSQINMRFVGNSYNTIIVDLDNVKYEVWNIDTKTKLSNN